MKVLITGASGQVGTALLRTAPPGYAVTALGHGELDIGSQSQVTATVAALRPDLIINAAAYTAVDRAEGDAEAAHLVNATGPRNLAGAAVASGARLMQISTDFVFGGDRATAYAPADATGPLNVYGATKLEGERAVLELLPGRVLVLRTAWVYASGGSNFLRTMLRLMKERGAVRVVADQIGTPTAARSLAHALWNLAAVDTLPAVLHWTDVGVASWYDFAVAIAEEAAALGILPDGVKVTPIRTEEYPTPARRPRFSVLDCRETLAHCAMEATHWRTNLRRTLGEMRDA